MPGENFCLAISLFPLCCSAPPLYQRMFVPHLPLLSCWSSLYYLSIKISEINKNSYLSSCASFVSFLWRISEEFPCGHQMPQFWLKDTGSCNLGTPFSGFAPEDEGQKSTSPETPGSMILGRAYINMEQTVSLEAYNVQRAGVNQTRVQTWRERLGVSGSIL